MCVMLKPKEECPWLDYLIIDEQTCETKLSDNAPPDIVEAFNKAQKECAQQCPFNKN